MVQHFEIGEARAKLLDLIAAARRGEDIVIGRAGQSQVRMVPIDETEAQQLISRRR